ncbi:MAG: ankyrin repeat domain-containing protein [Steroidobacteraceae bacterium]|jgi:ankyrin repeat protein
MVPLWRVLLLCIAGASSASPLHECVANDDLLHLNRGLWLPGSIESPAPAKAVRSEVRRSAQGATGGVNASPAPEPPRIVPRPARPVPVNDQQRLFFAVYDGDLPRVQALLNSPDVDVNASYDALAKTSLINVAARECLPEITQALIRKGARIRADDAGAGGIDIRPVGSLISSLSVDILMRDHPVTVAGAPARTLEHYEATLRILLDAGADANELANTTQHLSALGQLADIAAFDGDARMAKLLLDHGAAIDDSPSATSPLIIAVGRGREDLVAEVLAARRPAAATLDAALLQSARAGQYGMASEILRAGANPNVSDRSRRPVLCDSLLRLPASRSFTLELVTRNADVNADCLRSSPLGMAIEDRELAEAILSRGADPNRPNDLGATPLTLANANEHELIDHLLTSGGHVGLPNADVAAYRQRGAVVGSVSWSILHKRDYLAARLIERNKLDATQDCGAVVYAASEGSTLALRALLEHGGDPNATSASGVSALMAASMRGQSDSLQILLAQSRTRVNQTTPLVFHPPHFEIYSESPPSPWFTGHQSALMFAVMGGQPEAVRILLAHGADARQRDAAGHTALEYPASAVLQQMLMGLKK